MIAIAPPDPRIAQCDRLPARAGYGQKLLLLVEWHIAKNHRDAAALLRAYFNSKRASRPSFFASIPAAAARSPYCD